MATWTGRLTYVDPQWSPSARPHQILHQPQTVALQEVPHIVAAAHHACETLTGLAHAEHDQVRAAAQAGRILVPARSLPAECDSRYPFVKAPRERVGVLLTSYGDAGRATRQAADAVGVVAEIVQAPSRSLTLARAAVTGNDRALAVLDATPGHTAEAGNGSRAPGLPGPVETTLLDLGVNDAGLLARSAEIDHDAERLIIDAAIKTEARQRPHLPDGLSRSAGTAALANHALKSGDPQAVALRRPPMRPQRELPEREP